MTTIIELLGGLGSGKSMVSPTSTYCCVQPDLPYDEAVEK